MKYQTIILLISSLAKAASFSTLITFDVDGTLVSSSPGWENGAHGRSFVHAVDTILGNGEPKPIRTIPEVLEKHEFHGSTDGLILLRLARKTLGDSFVSSDASSKVNVMQQSMFDFVSRCDDDEVATGIAPLPGILETLSTLATDYHHGEGNVACGLVTGNVEGIARRKMRALGIHATGALTPLPQPQGGRVWEGVEDIRFLGGFGSDYCSGDIDNKDRNYLDRGEQLAICVQRCIDLSSNKNTLERVIHVGDAPADILAAKAYVNHPTKPSNVCVSVVGVATGSYSVQELTDLCGEAVPGVWEPVVLDGKGVGDEQEFLSACGLI